MDISPQNLPLVAYSRVSTAGQAASGVGMDAQRHAVEQSAISQGLTVAGWYEDNGRSGASMNRRPGLRPPSRRSKPDGPGGLIVAKIDRLGRSSADVCGLVERANREGWRLIALDAGLDTTTAAGEMVAAALAMAARFEWRRISERQVEKHNALRRQGRRRGQVPVSAEIADRIIALRSDGLSLRAIGALLESKASRPPEAGRVGTPPPCARRSSLASGS